MKFLHIADVHLGASPDCQNLPGESRAREIWDSFSEVIERCKEEQIELLLIAGDLFHRQPLLRELKEVSYLFSKIPDTNVVFIVGNHDYLKRTSYYHSFQWPENVKPILEDGLSAVEIERLGVSVHGLSYTKQEIEEPLLHGAMPHNRTAIEILLAHGGDEKHLPFQKQKLIDADFDYVALGHIHKPQILVENYMAYAGALEPIDKNDTGQHGYIKGEITTNGTRIEFVPAAKREYKHIRLQVDESVTERRLMELLEEAMEVHGEEHIYKITVEGFRDPEMDFAMDYMDPKGNLVELSDETAPAYDFEKLLRQNQENLLGKYISGMIAAQPGTVEYQALYEGVQALLETKRG